MTGKTVPSQTPAAEDRSSWRRDLPTLMVLFAATLALRIYYLFAYPFAAPSCGLGWSQGLLQYRDVFDNHMPVFHILSAPLVALIGEDPRILFFMRLATLPL